MSTIRVSLGMASVELEGWESRTAAARMATVGYPTDDLIAATARALAAAHDARADVLMDLLNSQ